MSNNLLYRYTHLLKKYNIRACDVSSEDFLKLSMYSYGYTPFYFTNSNESPLNSWGKYLKLLSVRFLTNASKLEFINCMLSIRIKFLLIVKAMYYSNPFRMTFTFPPNLSVSCMIKWLPKPLKLWNITGPFLVNLRLTLKL